MKPLYNQLMDSKSAPRVAPKANTTQLGTAPMSLRSAMQKYASGGSVKPRTKLAVFGDSISSAVGYNPDGTTVTTHGNSLADYLGTNLKLSTADNTRGGATSVDSMNGVKNDPFKFNNFTQYITENNPETALLRYGAADAALLTDPATSLSNIERMVQISRENGTKPVLVGVTPFAKMGEINAGGITSTWITDERIAAANEINQGIQDLADKYGVQFIDVRKVPVPPGALLDGIHPNGEYGFALNQYISNQIEPFEDAKTGGFELPPTWNNYEGKDKIDWLNNNNISSDMLAKADVSQGDIDWMMQNGYTGNTAQQPQRMMAQAQPQGEMAQAQPQEQPQEMTGIAALRNRQAGYDEGLPQRSSPQPVDIGNGLRRTYGGNLIDSEGYPVDSNGQRLNNPYSSGNDGGLPDQAGYQGSSPQTGGMTLDNGQFIAGAPNEQGGVNIGTPDFFQQYAGNPELMRALSDAYGYDVSNPDIVASMQRQPQIKYPPELAPPPELRPDENHMRFIDEIMKSQPTPQSPFEEILPPTRQYGSISSQYYAPEQPEQQMARGGMAHSDIEQYLTRLGMIRK